MSDSLSLPATGRRNDQKIGKELVASLEIFAGWEEDSLCEADRYGPLLSPPYRRCARDTELEILMYDTSGDTPLHFYRYQCRFYVAHWDGGNVMSDNFRQFIELITEKTGIDAKRVEAVARDYFNNVD